MIKALTALLRATAVCLEEFAKAGGIALLVAYLRQRRDESAAQQRLADARRIDLALASDDPRRVERAYAELFDGTEAADDSGAVTGAVGGRGRGNGDDDDRLPPEGDAALEELRREAEDLSLVD